MELFPSLDDITKPNFSSAYRNIFAQCHTLCTSDDCLIIDKYLNHQSCFFSLSTFFASPLLFQLSLLISLSLSHSFIHSLVLSRFLTDSLSLSHTQSPSCYLSFPVSISMRFALHYILRTRYCEYSKGEG